ncbi:MAG: hypothetical protein HC814_02550, partial [Rhodobacteraceae bacterium]|nr:hypothetical protein [Paracoccaceae bacterium]
MRQVSLNDEVAGGPSWSADGTALRFHATGPEQVCNGGLMFATGDSQIVEFRIGTGERKMLTTGAGLKLVPTRVDTTRIAYLMRNAVGFVGEAVRIEGEFGRAQWTSNGKRMVFHRPVGDQRGQFTVRASLDPRFALMSLPGHASYSPDGKRVAFIRNNFGPAGVGNGALVVADASGANQVTLYTSPLEDNLTGPAWSPRGDRIAFGVGAFFRRAGEGPARIATLEPADSGLRMLSEESVNAGMPSWSPDARHIVFRIADGQSRGLHILDTATGARRKLDTGSDQDTFPYWSPAGDWITFTSFRDGNYEIYRIRPDGSGVRRLTRHSGHDAHATVSPDGKWVA